MRYLALIFCFLSSSFVSQAQDPLFISLETDSTNLETGQYYEVEIRVDGARELWMSTIQIHYDPNMVYVIGTKSGSPVRHGTLLNPNTSSVFRNWIEDNLIYYSISQLAPSEPISGSGLLGTFRIYPLSAGQTQLSFSQAEFTKAIFEERNGQRVGVGAEAIEFLPVLLELNISGATVEPPSEATATPLPTETSILTTQFFPTEEATLVNVTASARFPEPLHSENLPGSDDRFLLLLAIGLMLIGGFGTAFVFWRFKHK